MRQDDITAMNKINRTSFLANPRTPLLIFLLSIGVFLYYFTEKFLITDVYKFALVGAIYELLWLPMLLLLVVVPVGSILILVNKHSKKGFALFSILLIGAAIMMLFK